MKLKFPFVEGEYNVYLVGRDGKVLAHVTMYDGAPGSGQTVLFDAAVKAGKEISFCGMEFKLEDERIQ